jgi:hypothetical protein
VANYHHQKFLRWQFATSKFFDVANSAMSKKFIINFFDDFFDRSIHTLKIDFFFFFFFFFCGACMKVFVRICEL